MVKTRAVSWKVLDAYGEFCIVKSKCFRVNEDGKLYGHALVFYDVCGFDHGEIGDCFESFKTVGEAERCFDEMRGVR